MNHALSNNRSESKSLLAPLERLRDCNCCPRNCGANRIDPGGKLGYCNSGAGFHISSICAHRGEEPVIVGNHGIANIFFARCNMGCRYCQNWQISRTRGRIIANEMSPTEVCDQLEALLNDGCKTVGFVSPSHFIPQVEVIIAAMRERNVQSQRNRNPIYVFNTSSYDKAETIRAFDGRINVWLPDLKYLDEAIGREISDTPNYPEIATAAIREMFRQKGSRLWLDDEGHIESGLIIRHLVIPGKIENSKQVLRWIARELSHNVHVSLMSQYHPSARVAGDPDLGRMLHADEYAEVVAEFEALGFRNGWTQELDSPTNYLPDFIHGHPFEYDPAEEE